jgi:hypothetical protein
VLIELLQDAIIFGDQHLKRTARRTALQPLPAPRHRAGTEFLDRTDANPTVPPAVFQPSSWPFSTIC